MPSVEAIIWGTRPFGRVDEFGGEYAATSFGHLYFLPLVPRQTLWIVDHGDSPVAIPIRASARTIIVGYGRIWAPVLVAGIFFATGAAPSLPLLALIALALALAAWSWFGSGIHGALARRRSHFNRLAFGVRCEPARLRTEDRAGLQRRLEERWRAAGIDASPEDIARYGTRDAEVAVLAYGMLRLAGLARGREGASEHAAADRLLAGAHERIDVDAGPYRGHALGDSSDEAIRAIERDAAPSPLLANDLRTRAQAPLVIAVAITSLIGLGSLVSLSRTGFGRSVVLTETTSAPINRSAVVRCDRVSAPFGDGAFGVEHSWDLQDRSTVVAGYRLCHAGAIAILVKVPVPVEPVAEFRGLTARLDPTQRKLLLVSETVGDGVTPLDLLLDATRTPDRSRVAFHVLALGAMLAAWIGYVLWRRRNPPIEIA